MGTADALVRCLDDLEQTNDRMRAIFEERDTSWRLALVRLRRTQSAQLGDLANCLAAWVQEAPSEEARRSGQAMFSELRRNIVVTQTEWPLCLINDDAALEAYKLASRRSIDASDSFFSWARSRVRR